MQQLINRSAFIVFVNSSFKNFICCIIDISIPETFGLNQLFYYLYVIQRNIFLIQIYKLSDRLGMHVKKLLMKTLYGSICIIGVWITGVLYV